MRLATAHGRRPESVCAAPGSQDLLHWEPRDEPLIATAPVEITGGYHRDPFVFGEDGAWRMLLGSGLHRDHGRAGAVLQYTSEDLEHWTYAGVLHEATGAPNALDTGPLWECPQVFRAGRDDVLIYSVQMEGEPDPLRLCVYALGRLSEGRFDARVTGRLDYGNVFYAPAIAHDENGRIVMWGWVQEKHGRRDVDHAGALSLPRVVHVTDGELRVAPAPELAALRSVTLELGGLDADGVVALDPAPLTGLFEVEASLPCSSVTRLSLRAGGRSVYLLTFDGDRRVAEVTSGAFGPFEIPLPAARTDFHAVRLFVDGSLLELFVDDALAVTTRCYEDAPDEIGVTGLKGIDGVRVHLLDPAFAGRETG